MGEALWSQHRGFYVRGEKNWNFSEDPFSVSDSDSCLEWPWKGKVAEEEF